VKVWETLPGASRKNREHARGIGAIKAACAQRCKPNQNQNEAARNVCDEIQMNWIEMSDGSREGSETGDKGRRNRFDASSARCHVAAAAPVFARASVKRYGDEGEQ